MSGITFHDVVRDVAADFGRCPTDEEADYILWNHTGFPDFWTGDPIECCARQLDDYFLRAERKAHTDTLRVLYHVVRAYQGWRDVPAGLPNELTDDVIRIGEEHLRANQWWPTEEAK